VLKIKRSPPSFSPKNNIVLGALMPIFVFNNVTLLQNCTAAVQLLVAASRYEGFSDCSPDANNAA